MEGLSNKYLEDLCKLCFKKFFVGVYPSDADPITNRKTFSVIFNLSPHYDPGSHFVCVIKFENSIYYFDSLGVKPNNSNINHYLKTFKVPIIYSETKIQDDLSNFCGFFCFYFLLHVISEKKSIISFYEQFTSRGTRKNDILLMRFIYRKIKKIQL